MLYEPHYLGVLHDIQAAAESSGFGTHRHSKELIAFE